MKKRILIASGGTGGHFYPGYALAQELIKKGWQTLFLLRKNDPASRILAENELCSVETDITALPRTANPVKLALFSKKLLSSFFYARKILKDWEPSLVAGTGSYVSFPAVLAAKTLKIPSLIHESNAILGLSNELCSLFASGIALGFPLAKNSGLKKNFQLTGTPVREYFRNMPEPDESRKYFGLNPKKTTTLIFGGSQGAESLNIAASAAVKIMVNNENLQFIHITGRRNYESITQSYACAGTLKCGRLKILDYCDEMHKAYSAADIVIARSGASTCAELIQTQKPAILIPLPSSAAGHKAENAKTLERSGAAFMINESPDLSEKIQRKLAEMISSRGMLEKIRQNYGGINIPAPVCAAANLADFAVKLAENATNQKTEVRIQESE